MTLVYAVTALAHLVLPAMIKRGSGRIINVASVAGFSPGVAGHTLYPGCKSFLIKFSQSLDCELRAEGIKVTALCRAQISHRRHPRSSALDPFCKAHDLDNLYVVDSAFFVSSSAVNPTLTIVAKAIRVAEHLKDRLCVSATGATEPTAAAREVEIALAPNGTAHPAVIAQTKKRGWGLFRRKH